MTAPESLPAWGGQPWAGPAWGGQPWAGQPWDPPAWTPPFPGSGEDPLPPLLQLQQSLSFSDLEATLDICGENPNMVPPPAKYFNAPQIVDLLPGCPTSVQSEDV
ncbi:putative homeobox protein NANOG2 [Galemys pyrenaicus]|uniref:Putative homeobox protein NANOG2 n=1 Tax=Galemys pyrenaicus TaxID=202257 RepID=A0A8J6AP03_GALPY|nr:putative homeobox protein NANOG2 [Galemys pyrenaicus]